MTLLSAVDPVDDSAADKWLDEQADLTAVERFSQRHESEAIPRQAKYYKDFLPATCPKPGQQYAFEVDLDSCTSCKSCVSACHSLNGLDEGESWRSVRLVAGRTEAGPFQQTVTSACHHCVEPACLTGCPVDAYEKDPITGIVSHLDDQCIGCSYCTLTCPYEVPVFNHDRGIVRKCDMCKDRLAEGEAPACVQACPNGAIAITVVRTDTARAAVEAPLAPDAPPSRITVPTTVYKSAWGTTTEVERIVAVDRPAQAHTPLAVMLVLTQLSVGAFVVDVVLRTVGGRGSGLVARFDAALAVATGVLALGASVFHLGRPLYFYRSVIGLRHSWLSREVVAFGAFTGLAVPYAALLWAAPAWADGLLPALGVAVAATGLVGVVCSVLIYSTTHRASWHARTVGTTFALSAAVTGTATVAWAADLAALASSHAVDLPRRLVLTVPILLAIKLAREAWPLVRPTRSDVNRRRARLMVNDLRRPATWRFALGAAGIVSVLAAAAPRPGTWATFVLATAALVIVVAGELVERSLFFTTASPPR